MLQQCLACNSLITGSSRSCACGHVFEDAIRFIGGKRFSEYRAMLYSRLENRKKKKEARQITKQSGNQQDPLKELKNQMPVVAERLSFKPTGKRRTTVSRTTNKTKKRKESFALKRPQKSTCPVPQQLLTRFPSALQGINRKIMVQNMVWLALQLE